MFSRLEAKKAFAFDSQKIIYETSPRLRVALDAGRTHLPVHQAHDGRLHPHPHGEARVHVLMVEEGLEAREQEHEGGVEVALPQRSVFVSHESQEQAEVEEKQKD